MFLLVPTGSVFKWGNSSLVIKILLMITNLKFPHLNTEPVGITY